MLYMLLQIDTDKKYHIYFVIYLMKIYLPDRATMSLWLSPLLAKADTRVWRLAKGLGRSVFALARSAVVESLLPSFGVHVGPPT